jgi:ATP dependent DNA ligase domain/ATP dependent DNA ligase C terminal region
MAINLKFDRSRFTRKKGDYFVGMADGLADPTLQARTQEYKRRLSGIMRPLSSEDIYRILDANGYYVTRKYNGEFVLIAYDGKELLSINPRGTVRGGLPAYEEAEKLLKNAKVRSCLLGAEIYMPIGDKKESKVYQVSSALRSPSSAAELEKLTLAVFDVIEVDNGPVAATADVFKLLYRWFEKGKLVHPAEYKVAKDLKVVRELFNEWVTGGGSEGLVVRHDQAGWYKIKERHNIDVAIIGCSEGVDDRKGMLHDLLVAVMRKDGTFHEFARVGGGFTDDDRKNIVSQLKPRVAPSDYVAVNNDFVAYEMIEPGPVVEISALDLISEGAKGDPIKKMVLEWSGEKYQSLARMPLASVISPQFVRMRDDKEANVEDVNISQLEAFINVEEAEKSARAEHLPESKLLERVVYTKVLKGQRMVRKLLLWKTNKENRSNFPGYVVYLTDFSPNRQNPLEREIRVARTEKVAREWFQRLAAENFVGGWEKVS